MAKIVCTVLEFHKYLGPRIRNIVQAMTKKRKKELNHICQECKQTKELEAAHVKGNSRKDIIERILKEHIIDLKNNLIEIDPDRIEKEIILAHKPIDKYFRFLCSKCHTKYDSK